MDFLIASRNLEALAACEALLPSGERLRKVGAVRVEGARCGEIPEALLAAALEHEVDLLALPEGLSIRNFRVACFDMDSTLIGNECIDDLAALCGRGAEVAEMTRLAMEGHLEFSENLRRRVSVLAGAPASIVEEACLDLRLNPGVESWIAFLRKAGLQTYILSGGFAQLAATVAKRLGMTGFACNTLVEHQGRLTGEVRGPAEGRILDADGKRRAAEVLAQVNGASLAETICGGDGANDLEMVAAAGFGFAYHGKPVLARTARYAVRFGGFEVLENCFVESWR